MFFIIAQKINNLLLKQNDIFNYKIGTVGALFYLIIFILIKFPILNKINSNNWLLFSIFVGFLLIDAILIGNDYIITIKKLKKVNDVILNDAKLNDAKLNDAKLNDAKLNDAKLNDAILNDAILNDAILNDAKLNDAKLNEASLNDYETTTDLETTNDLDVNKSP